MTHPILVNLRKRLSLLAINVFWLPNHQDAVSVLWINIYLTAKKGHSAFEEWAISYFGNPYPIGLKKALLDDSKKYGHDDKLIAQLAGIPEEAIYLIGQIKPNQIRISNRLFKIFWNYEPPTPSIFRGGPSGM